MEDRIKKLEKTVKYLERELEIVYRDHNNALLILNKNIKKNTIKLATYEIDLRNFKNATNRQSTAQGNYKKTKKRYKKHIKKNK